ncbi:MAG TPA: hypothetical protein VNO31_14085, partial [Umezawaea sp.]|nr:hypothetical protein [Umezawaea sp.]
VGGSDGADIYAAAPGASYEILVHDGTWLGIYEQLAAALAVATDAGVTSALVINGMSALWAMLQDAIDRRARRREGNGLVSRGLDPNLAYSSEIEVPLLGDQWSLVNRRHDALMDLVKAWPGPVVMIARDKTTAEGRTYTKAHDSLGERCTAWIRLAVDQEPEIVKLNTARYQYADKETRAQLRKDFSLSRLIWEWSGCTSETRAPEVIVLDADQVLPSEQAPPRPAPPSERKPAARRPAPAVVESEADAPATDRAAEARAVADMVQELVALAERKLVGPTWTRAKELGAVKEAADVSGLLTEHERERLGAVAPYSLGQLSTDVCRMVNETGVALRTDLVES